MPAFDCDSNRYMAHKTATGSQVAAAAHHHHRSSGLGAHRGTEWARSSSSAQLIYMIQPVQGSTLRQGAETVLKHGRFSEQSDDGQRTELRAP